MFDLLSKKQSNNYSEKLDQLFQPIKTDLCSLESFLNESLASGNADLDKITSYVFKSGGKRLRPAIIIVFIKALNQGKYVSEEQFSIAQAVEMIHTATLLHDDVIDEAETRRGVMTVWKKWGTKSAIITGDYILSRALNKLVKVGSIAVEMFSSVLNELCIGEILQENQKFKVITVDEYINKSERKTAQLFMVGVECAASIMPNTNNLIIKAARGYSLNFGTAFQIIDDILNFKNSKASDLKDGIVTAPVIFAVEEYAQKGDFTLKNLVENGLKSDKDFKHAIKLVLASRGMEKARDLADEYAQRAISSLDVVPDNLYRHILIDLANYTAERVL